MSGCGAAAVGSVRRRPGGAGGDRTPQRVTALGGGAAPPGLRTGPGGAARPHLSASGRAEREPSGLREAGGPGPTGRESAGVGGRQGPARCHRAVPSRGEGRRAHAGSRRVFGLQALRVGTGTLPRETDAPVSDFAGSFAWQRHGYAYRTAADLPSPHLTCAPESPADPAHVRWFRLSVSC